jgi:hypothetical protein
MSRERFDVAYGWGWRLNHLLSLQLQIKKAYCPPQVVAGNPILDYAKHIVIGFYGKITIRIGEVRSARPHGNSRRDH